MCYAAFSVGMCRSSALVRMELLDSMGIATFLYNLNDIPQKSCGHVTSTWPLF